MKLFKSALEKSLEEAKAEMEQEKKEAAEEKKTHPNRFTHNRYKIFRVEKDPKTGKGKKITMKKFWAKDDKEAFAELKEYRRVANREYTYYWGDAEGHITRDKNGKKILCDDFEEVMAVDRAQHCSLYNFIDDKWTDVCIFWRKICDLRYKLRDVLYWLKTKHNYNESWSLDIHMINDLHHNIPLIIEDKIGTPTYFHEIALKEKHKGDPKWKLEDALNKDPNCIDEVSDEARALWEAELNKFWNYVKAYIFFTSYGSVDHKDKALVDFAEENASQIPYKPGTYNDIDYAKLHILTQKSWNSIWNWMKQYGQMLWT